MFIDGNHENHPRLNSFPETWICGARAHQISISVYHIIRGEILELGDAAVLCIGGADSLDKAWRTEGEDWWREEQISESDIENANNGLSCREHTIDYVITHCLPQSILSRLFPTMNPTRSSRLLDSVFWNAEIQKKWIAGHYHKDEIYEEQEGIFHLIYDDIVELEIET